MSTPPEKNSDSESPQDCPWALHPATGEHERLSPPAPMIELDTPVESAPVKPLGPRRLARLQREMAEHAREIQESERSRGATVDDALLAKQQRLADLAVRAAAANERDRKDAQRAVAANDAAQVPVSAAAPEAVATSWPASPVDYGPGPATTQIPIYTAPEPAPEPATTPVTADPDPAPATSGQTAPHAVKETDSADPRENGAGEHTVGDAASSSVEKPADQRVEPPVDDSHHAPPGQPVRAVDAEGLELLAPGAYRNRAPGMRWLLALLLVVIAALVVVLVTFIL